MQRNLSRNVFVVVLMMVVGFLVGRRIHTNVLGLIGGGLLVLLFGYAMSWIFATVGLAVGDPETASGRFPILAPLVFASTALGRQIRCLGSRSGHGTNRYQLRPTRGVR